MFPLDLPPVAVPFSIFLCCIAGMDGFDVDDEVPGRDEDDDEDAPDGVAKAVEPLVVCCCCIDPLPIILPPLGLIICCCC